MDPLRLGSHEPEEREEFYRAILEAAFDGIVVSQDGAIVDVSRRLLGMSGYTADELIGRPVTDFVADELRAEVRHRQAAELEGTFDAAIVLKDGRRFDVEVVARNHLIAGRRSRVAALRDVTDRRRLEAMLRQAQKMEAVGRFASSIAHDFNNVLTVIRSYSDILLRELDGPHHRDALEILKAADIGAALARQLLAYGRDQGTSPSPLDVNDIVHASEGLLRRLLGARIALSTSLAAVAGPVRADMSQLQQVILNLAVNAHDAMPRGGRLEIRTDTVDVTAAQAAPYAVRPGRYALLAVTDTGSGMTDDVKAHLFEPFFTTKEPGHGTGLGLSIVRQIVEQSNGFIVVDSSIGAGTTFAIHLPLLTRPGVE